MNPNGISVVIPAYNEAKFLPATLRAIQIAQARFTQDQVSEIRALGSRSASSVPAWPPIEVIVVNNASTDDTAAVAQELGVRVIDHEIRNISSVRNAGIRAAQYPIVVMIDADSFLPEHAFTEVVQVMRRGDVIGGAFHVKILTENRLLAVLAPLFQRVIRAIAGISGAMFFFNRDAAIAMGGFREDRLAAEDSRFSLDLIRYGRDHGGRRFVYLRQVTVGTLDRKDSDLRTSFRWMRLALQAFMGRKQDIKDLDYWYDPKR